MLMQDSQNLQQNLERGKCLAMPSFLLGNLWLLWKDLPQKMIWARVHQWTHLLSASLQSIALPAMLHLVCKALVYCHQEKGPNHGVLTTILLNAIGSWLFSSSGLCILSLYLCWWLALSCFVSYGLCIASSFLCPACNWLCNLLLFGLIPCITSSMKTEGLAFSTTPYFK